MVWSSANGDTWICYLKWRLCLWLIPPLIRNSAELRNKLRIYWNETWRCSKHGKDIRCLICPETRHICINFHNMPNAHYICANIAIINEVSQFPYYSREQFTQSAQKRILSDGVFLCQIKPIVSSRPLSKSPVAVSWYNIIVLKFKYEFFCEHYTKLSSTVNMIRFTGPIGEPVFARYIRYRMTR